MVPLRNAFVPQSVVVTANTKGKSMLTPLSRTLSVFMIGLSGFLAVFILSAFTTSVPTSVPPRVTLTPTPTAIPASTPIATAVPADSAAIYLHTEPSTTGLWTAVQWLDGDEWRDVVGWQASLNESGMVAWAVAPTNFGERPFRWLIYDRQGGKLIATSDPFALPDHEHQIIRVTVTVPYIP